MINSNLICTQIPRKIKKPKPIKEIHMTQKQLCFLQAVISPTLAGGKPELRSDLVLLLHEAVYKI